MRDNPLSMEELRYYEKLCSPESPFSNYPGHTPSYPLSKQQCWNLLATIRRRDELIRWLVRSGCHRLRDFSKLPNVVGEESAQNATEIIEIVEAGDG